MTADLLYFVVGAALLLAVLVPSVLHRHAVSAPIVLLLVGLVVGLLPLPEGFLTDPAEDLALTEHLAELAVVVALMGVGLAMDRPLGLRSWVSWKRWGATWRLLAIAMPLCVAGTALLGWWVMGLAPAAALLLGAALAPTDPVLASDVQVQGPTPLNDEDEKIDEEDEVRFAVTSEAGLNDGLAFPFVYAAILAATMGPVTEWGLRWVAWELAGKVTLGVLIGTAVGWLLAQLAFRAAAPTMRLAETGEPLLAIAAILLSYGVAEVAQGYGFLAVFACAMTVRSAERGHEYQAHMHGLVEQLERLLTLGLLLLLGSWLTNTLIADLTWHGAVVGLALIFVVRPLTGAVALRLRPRGGRMGGRCLTPHEELATAWFGVRGISSLYYLSYAIGEADFGTSRQMWAVVGFTIAVSVLVHGVTATPFMRHLEAAKGKTAGR